jgi:hypothetical protein
MRGATSVRPPRNLICPATEAACTDPECKQGLCREIKRQDDAYAQEQVLRGKIVPEYDFDFMRLPKEQNGTPNQRVNKGGLVAFFIVMMLLALVLGIMLRTAGFKTRAPPRMLKSTTILCAENYLRPNCFGIPNLLDKSIRKTTGS